MSALHRLVETQEHVNWLMPLRKQQAPAANDGGPAARLRAARLRAARLRAARLPAACVAAEDPLGMDDLSPALLWWLGRLACAFSAVATASMLTAILAVGVF
jgi:hypothetical protein